MLSHILPSLPAVTHTHTHRLTRAHTDTQRSSGVHTAVPVLAGCSMSAAAEEEEEEEGRRRRRRGEERRGRSRDRILVSDTVRTLGEGEAAGAASEEDERDEAEAQKDAEKDEAVKPPQILLYVVLLQHRLAGVLARKGRRACGKQLVNRALLWGSLGCCRAHLPHPGWAGP